MKTAAFIIGVMAAIIIAVLGYQLNRLHAIPFSQRTSNEANLINMHVTTDTIFHVACYRFEDGQVGGCIHVDSADWVKAFPLQKP